MHAGSLGTVKGGVQRVDDVGKAIAIERFWQ
jgi:hypothetical protein